MPVGARTGITIIVYKICAYMRRKCGDKAEDETCESEMFPDYERTKEKWQEACGNKWETDGLNKVTYHKFNFEE